MLEFIEEEQSGQLFARSETSTGKSYWIDEGAAWVYLTVVQGDRAGPNIGSSIIFNDIEDAKEAAEKLEGETDGG